MDKNLKPNVIIMKINDLIQFYNQHDVETDSYHNHLQFTEAQADLETINILKNLASAILYTTEAEIEKQLKYKLEV